MKRLAAVIPTLWFITSVVFILSKLIPGNTSLFEEEDLAYANSVSSRQAYTQYLHRTGQHLPLFYWSIRTYAEPDTLYKILSKSEREYLKNMVLIYGNWPAIATYYHHLKYLQNSIHHVKTTSAVRANYTNQLENLFVVSDTAKVNRQFHSLKQLNKQQIRDTQLLGFINNAQQSFAFLAQNQTYYLNLIPVIQWHGLQNQYHQWCAGLINGSLGISLSDERPVTSIIWEAIGNTFLLSLCTLTLVFLLAIFLAVFMIHEDFRRWRNFVLNGLYLVDTIPVFLLALLLLIFLAASNSLLVFPLFGLGEVSENTPWLEGLTIRLHHLFLPVLCLTLANLPYVTGQLFQSMREVEVSEYIIAARAKGLPENFVVGKHMLSNALLPLITLFSGFLPVLIGGALVIEVIFAIPGMGSLLVHSILSRDYPLLLGIVLVLAFVKVISHILADILYYWADPRIRF